MQFPLISCPLLYLCVIVYEGNKILIGHLESRTMTGLSLYCVDNLCGMKVDKGGD